MENLYVENYKIQLKKFKEDLKLYKFKDSMLLIYQLPPNLM